MPIRYRVLGFICPMLLGSPSSAFMVPSKQRGQKRIAEQPLPPTPVFYSAQCSCFPFNKDVQVKLEASFGSPEPLYLGYSPYPHIGREAVT
jgi:hypothetical protein